MTTMIYRCPGPHLLHGVECEYKIVDADGVDDALAEGWSRTPKEAAEKGGKSDELDGLTREELEQLAKDAGISVRSNWKDSTIVEKLRKAS